jgi:hypothetical protein
MKRLPYALPIIIRVKRLFGLWTGALDVFLCSVATFVFPDNVQL